MASGSRDAAVHDVDRRAPGAKVTGQEMSHGHVAGEDESGLPPFCYDGEQVVEASELARASDLGVSIPVVGARAQVVRRGVADLAERLQHAQDETPALDAAARADLAEGIAGDGGVQGRLLRGQLDQVLADDLAREFSGDGRVGLPAPEEEGADEAVQGRCRLKVLRGSRHHLADRADRTLMLLAQRLGDRRNLSRGRVLKLGKFLLETARHG